MEYKYNQINFHAENKLRLLFLAYAFPPLAVTGSQRAGYMAKYLSRLGWKVTVVTPDPSLWLRANNVEKSNRMIEQEGIQLIKTGLRWRCLEPAAYLRFNDHGLKWIISGVCRRIASRLWIEHQAGWLKAVEIACKSLKRADVDVIMVTGNPYISFRAAWQLSQRLQVPFLLDYRDLWTGNPHASRPFPSRIVAEERFLLNACSAAITVSPSCAKSLKDNFPDVQSVHVVMNGYDPEDLLDIQPRHYGHFAIVYTGIFYPPYRTITPILNALNLLDSDRNHNLPEWRFHYFGTDGKHVFSEAEHYGLINRVVLHGQVPREESLSAVAGADVSVVITSNKETGSLADNGVITSKIFEALGLGTRILLIAPKGSDAETIVKEAGAGGSFTGKQTEEIAKYFREIMVNGKSNLIPPTQHSWPEIALQLNALLRQIVKEHAKETANACIASNDQ